MENGESPYIGTSHHGSARLVVQTFWPLQRFCRLPLSILPAEWVSGDGGYRRQSLRLSRVALPLSQALKADTPPQKGERCRTTAKLSEAH